MYKRQVDPRQSEDLVRSELTSQPGMMDPISGQASSVSSPPVDISSSPWYEKEVVTTERWDRVASSSQSSESTTAAGQTSVAGEFIDVTHVSNTNIEPENT